MNIDQEAGHVFLWGVDVQSKARWSKCAGLVEEEKQSRLGEEATNYLIPAKSFRR